MTYKDLFKNSKTMSLDGGVDMYSMDFKRYGDKDECEGRIVVFRGNGGYDSELESACKEFEIGQQLEVEEIEVSRSSSKVKFKGNDKYYNTVMFADAEFGFLGMYISVCIDRLEVKND